MKAGGADDVTRSGPASSGTCGKCHCEGRWVSTEDGKWGQTSCPLGSHILPGDMIVTDCSGVPAGGCEDTFGGRR